MNAKHTPYSTSSGDFSPTVAWGGGTYLVAWPDKLSSLYVIRAARVSGGGLLMDSKGITLSASSGSSFRPRASYLQPNFLVVWSNSFYDILGAGVSSAGTITTGTSDLSVCGGSSISRYPALACGLTSCLSSWRDTRNGFNDVYGELAKP